MYNLKDYFFNLLAETHNVLGELEILSDEEKEKIRQAAAALTKKHENTEITKENIFTICNELKTKIPKEHLNFIRLSIKLHLYQYRDESSNQTPENTINLCKLLLKTNVKLTWPYYLIGLTYSYTHDENITKAFTPLMKVAARRNDFLSGWQQLEIYHQQLLDKNYDVCQIYDMDSKLISQLMILLKKNSKISNECPKLTSMIFYMCGCNIITKKKRVCYAII